jgi:hypothetical protein
MNEYGAKPVYEKIEFCRKPETLWAKIESGRWDWLGIHPRGQFVLGSPPGRRGSSMLASPTVCKDGASEGKHGVYVRTPLGPGPSATWFSSEQQAQAEFQKEVDNQRDKGKEPGLIKVQLIEKWLIVDEELIVRRPSTYR